MPQGHVSAAHPRSIESDSQTSVGLMAAPAPVNKIMDIHISGCNHGYLVTVGCSNFAIEKASDLIAKLSEYLNNPAAIEQKWRDGVLF